MDKTNNNQCIFCNAIFSKKEHLKRHEDSIHKNVKFDCQDCGKQYKQKGKLTMHINNVHKGMKYKCDQCDNEFTDPGNRNQHIKSVHEQKKYPCTLCDYQANQQSSLTRHKKSVLKVSSIHAQYVDITQLRKVILMDIFSQNIKERSISVILVIKNIHNPHISCSILNQFIKV